ATSDRFVLGGHGRTVGVQLAYSSARTEAQTYRKTMLHAASKDGNGVESASKNKNTINEREIEKKDVPKNVSALFNEDMSEGKSQATEAVSRANRVSQTTADAVAGMLEPDQDGNTPSIREVMGSQKKMTRIV